MQLATIDINENPDRPSDWHRRPRSKRELELDEQLRKRKANQEERRRNREERGRLGLSILGLCAEVDLDLAAGVKRAIERNRPEESHR